MDTTQLVRQATPTEYPPVARGYIGRAPESFADLVEVILPAGSTERHYGPCPFPAIHGTRLPAEGDICVIVFDEQNHPTIVWWEGVQREPTPAAESITEAMLAKAVQEKLKPSAWTELTLNTKLEAFGGFQTPAVRSEQGKTVARLRGIVKVKAGQELKAGETVATLAENVRPPASVVLINEINGAFSFATITSAGVITLSATAPAAAGISLDGLTYNLT